ncbi:MAG TPA: hypothetical protein VG253_16785 [Streptosporangiaceae bacterium]|jgi:hypothetical protein|nr:hypothetical protein [Streptosporangiaceae bacterium]
MTRNRIAPVHHLTIMVGSAASARPTTGQLTPSIESSEVRWVPASEVLGYTMDRSMRIRINDFLTCNDSPVVTWSSPARVPD